MLKLLKLEWLKLSSFGAARAFFFIYLGITILLFLSIRLVAGASGFNAPDLWLNLAYYARWVNSLFLGLVVILFISSEYRNKTLRQSLINSLSRMELAGSKSLVILVLAVGVMLFYTLLGGVLYLSQGSGAEGFLSEYYRMPAMALQAVGFMTLAALIAILVKNPVLSMLIYLMYYPVETSIRIFLKDVFELPQWTHAYWPARAMVDLTGSPLGGEVSIQGRNIFEKAMITAGERIDIAPAAVAVVVFVVVATTLYSWYWQKADL